MTPEVLKIKREQKGISQFALAIATGIGRFKISCFECGYKELSKAETHKILKFMNRKRKTTPPTPTLQG